MKRAIDIVAERLNPKKKPVNEDGEEVKEGEDGAAEEEKDEDDEDEDEEEEQEMTPRTLAKRVEMILESITFEGFSYVRRGTFEAHKLVVATMLCLRINVRKGLIKQDEVDALIKKEVSGDPGQIPDSLAKFIPESIWPAVVGLQNVKLFENLISAMESESL